MDPALAQLGWTEEQWNRICTTVTEEAQRARVAAQVLPVVGPEDPSTIAIPRFTLEPELVGMGAQPWPALKRLAVDSLPSLGLTTISVNVAVRGHEAADPELGAALTMFRRAANYVVTLEDAIVFNGRTAGPNPIIGGPPSRVPPVFKVGTDSKAPEMGLLTGGAVILWIPARTPNKVDGLDVVRATIAAMTELEARGQHGPFGLMLGSTLFEAAHDPTVSLSLPRDTILSLIQGPLVRVNTVSKTMGAMVALSGSPVELVVASDISVRYLTTTAEPRYIFRVVEQIGLRIKESEAIAVMLAE